MQKLNQIVKDIKALKIQGAENISKEAAKCIKSLVLTSKSESKKDFLKEVNTAIKQLTLSRPTEPCLRNTLNFISLSLNPALDLRQLKEEIISSAQKVLKHFMDTDKAIFEIGSKKIKNGTIVFTHCHSSTVMGILKSAKNQKKNFTVNNTETRPRFQGRITAKELASVGIKVNHFIDSSARIALKKADIMLIGCDAITPDRIINKIGSELFSEVAKDHDVPIYICTNSWKFDPKTIFGIEEKIEERDTREVWDSPPKNVKIFNPAFEKIDYDLITGIISELGIYPPEVFIEEVKSKYPWMFK